MRDLPVPQTENYKRRGRYFEKNMSISSVCSDLKKGKIKRGLRKLMLISKKALTATEEIIQETCQKEVAKFVRKEKFPSLNQVTLETFNWGPLIQKLKAAMPLLYSAISGAFKRNIGSAE